MEHYNIILIQIYVIIPYLHYVIAIIIYVTMQFLLWFMLQHNSFYNLHCINNIM